MKTGILAQQSGKENPTNLLSNGNFEDWASGTTASPNAWIEIDADTIAIRESSVIKLGTYSCKLSNDNSARAYIYQDIHSAKGIDYWKNRKVTLGCWVYTNTASRVYVNIDDGVGDGSSSYHTGDSTWQWLTATKTIAGAATQVRIELFIKVGANTSAYFDGAMCVEGESAFAFSDKPASYLEGDWTAVFTADTGTITLNTSYKTGHYIKIGKQVTVTGLFVVSSVSSPTGQLMLTGLPFVCGSGTKMYSAVFFNVSALLTGAGGSTVGDIDSATSRVLIYGYNDGNQFALASKVQATSVFIFTATYFTD